MTTTALLVSTRKGAWIFRADAMRASWAVDGPHFLGHIISHLVLDPRDQITLLAAAKIVSIAASVSTNAPSRADITAMRPRS